MLMQRAPREEDQFSVTGALTSITAFIMLSREEILKPIWYAFTALDVDRNGKVSKSQLKVSKLAYSTVNYHLFELRFPCIGSRESFIRFKNDSLPIKCIYSYDFLF